MVVAVVKIVAKTDKGIVREENQDAYSVCELPNEVAWAVVCDGMGGAAGGNIASALAVKVISEKLSATYHDDLTENSIYGILEAAVRIANLEVYNLAVTRPELEGMGTTVVCAIVRDSDVYIAHAGDSRAYLANKDGLTQLTMDHSMVQDLVNKGKITPEEAEHHPNKNYITRAVGVDKYIEVDFDHTELKENETLLLCTDGLSNYVSSDELLDDISDGQYYAFADRLVKRANNNGGGDNITVVAITK